MRVSVKRVMGAVAVAACVLSVPTQARAFCGTFVSSGEGELFNSATNVALMREGTTTVLSMQNNYQGPAEDFAMIIPVPEVLMQDQVKTLDDSVFARLDTLTAPRLVEYAEKDPCTDTTFMDYEFCYDGLNNQAVPGGEFNGADMGSSVDPSPPPQVEAEFVVGEYEVVILSAEEATGLEVWLGENGYNIPAGGTDVLGSYIEQGMFFFVAKVDPAKVTFDADGNAVLSPLRFSYTSDDFSLPIRLGLLNSSGLQDLIVYVIAPNDRYEVANYPNVTIPTNTMVKNAVREDFGSFYERLFASTVRENPGAVVTEYAWGGFSPPFNPSVKCDPCPPGITAGQPTMLPNEDVSVLGGDVLDPTFYGEGADPNAIPEVQWNNLLVTRLHARYGKGDVSQDLVFRTAPMLFGGIGGSGAEQQQTRTDANRNISQFQGRYIIHNRWSGEIACDDPVRGRWIGAGLQDSAPSPNTMGMTPVDVSDVAFDDLLDTDALPPTGQPRRIFVSCEDQGIPRGGGDGIDDPGTPDTPDEPADRRWFGSDDDDDGGPDCSAAPSQHTPTAPIALLLGLVGVAGLAGRRRR